jgi:hypothetical protein
MDAQASVIARRNEVGCRRVSPLPTHAGFWLLLLAFAVLVAARIPAVWPHGRLWAEEASVYLVNAWTQPWFAALLAVHTGYINLPAAGATALAVHLVPLEYVACVTVVLALLIQMVPAVLLLTSGIPWLRGWRTLVPALLLLALPPAAEEVWLNTITSQFHVLLATAIILASPPGRRRVAVFQGAVLLVAPLCGAPGAALLPLFLLRAWHDGSRSRLVQAMLLLPATGVQLIVLLMHPEPARTVGFDLPLVLAAVTGKQILLPLLGSRIAFRLTRGVVAAFAAGQPPMLFVLTPLLAFGTLGVAVWRNQDASARWLYAGGIMMMAVSYLGALSPGSKLDLLMSNYGIRYYYGPDVLISLTSLGLAATGAGVTRMLATCLVAWLILVGMVHYFHVRAVTTSGPSWRAEVVLWRADPSHPIAVWPAGWQIRLDHR